MNPATILALISDLYMQVQQMARTVEEQKARIAELEAENAGLRSPPDTDGSVPAI